MLSPSPPPSSFAAARVKRPNTNNGTIKLNSEWRHAYHRRPPRPAVSDEYNVLTQITNYFGERRSFSGHTT